ncbi:MAG: methionine aminotransferase [Flavobacteriaceae bacterium]|nr:methionine aminotransferase [Flavobacteriaceae bacterium]
MFSSKFPSVTTSIFSVMSKMASEHNAINLSQGFPNFKSDPVLLDLVTKAMKDGHNQYAPMPGDLKLREQISAKIEALHTKKYNPDTEIICTAGATQAIFTAIAATIQKNDEVILFTPAYDCYAPSITLFGGKVIPVQLHAPFYKPDWHQVKEAISSKTKMIIINSPHNPSGMLFTEKDMLQLQEISEKNNLLVLSDEVYEHIIFDGEIHQSAARFDVLAARTFITASFGKTFHNTGWKMGYCVAPEKLMTEFRKVHQYVVFCVNHPIQKALATYLQDSSHYLELGAFYQQKRDYFITLLQGSRFTVVPSKGTYFQLLDYSKITQQNDVAFAEKLTKQHGIATIPTSVFNANNEDFKQLRVCFAKTEITLQNAAEILRTI